MYGPHYKIPIAYETAPSVTTDNTAPPEIVVTPKMIEAGAFEVMAEVGGADLGGQFSAGELAKRVYRAMAKKLMEERGGNGWPA